VTRFNLRTLTAAGTILLLASAAPAAEEISSQERAKLVQYLTSTRDQVLAEAANLSDAQWSFKPAPDRWSVGEVVEHLALAEPFIFEMQQKTMAGPAATAEQRAAVQSKDEMLLKKIPDRTQKANAPEPLQPTKRLGPRADVLAAFKERRAKTIDYANQTSDDLRGRVGESALGPIDGYQWLLFISAHTERHLGQIREVKAHAQFPKSTSD
jgi:DinB superfamily